jgi:DNA-binding NarL/FixJ family response regulator
MKKDNHNVEILVADRDINHRSALRLLLLNDCKNVNVTEASDLDSINTLMGAHRFNVIILDWNFVRNGVRDLIKNCHETDGHTHIIVLSARLENKAAALDAGASAFVYKGDPPEVLHTTLLTFVEKAAARINRKPSVLPSCTRPIYCHYLI